LPLRYPTICNNQILEAMQYCRFYTVLLRYPTICNNQILEAMQYCRFYTVLLNAY